jgi:DNA-binding NtrC family response regulator
VGGGLTNAVTVLFVTPIDADHIRLAWIVSHSRWELHRATGCREALAFLREQHFGVVIANSELPDGTWQDFLDELATLPHPPNLVVASRLADERLWAEALNLGAYDLLPTPFEPDEVLRVTYLAWDAWRRTGTLTPARKPVSTEGSSETGGQSSATGAGR